MKKLNVDFNSTEDDLVVIIRFDLDINPEYLKNELSVGEKIIVSDNYEECEAIVRKGITYEWAAKLLLETFRRSPEI